MNIRKYTPKLNKWVQCSSKPYLPSPTKLISTGVLKPYFKVVIFRVKTTWLFGNNVFINTHVTFFEAKEK